MVRLGCGAGGRAGPHTARNRNRIRQEEEAPADHRWRKAVARSSSHALGGLGGEGKGRDKDPVFSKGKGRGKDPVFGEGKGRGKVHGTGRRGVARG